MRLQAEVQAGFRAALFGARPPEGLGPQGELRFAVYRNNVLHGLARALAQRFPVIEALLGAESFVALARAFLAVEPPASPLLFAWGEGFADFLDAMPALAALPYLGDVARLEWARGLAWHAADARAVDPRHLLAAAQSPASLRLGLHPALRLLETRHAAHSIWAAHQPGGSLTGLDPFRPESTLIQRDPADRIVTEALSPPDARMLRALMHGAALLAALSAAGPGHDPTPLILLLVRHGAIISLTGVST